MLEVNREISVSFVRHSKTGLIVATSDDLPGLIVHGRTFAELDKAIPFAIKSLLEADSQATVTVEKRGESVNVPTAFEPSVLHFHAQRAA